MTTVIDVVSVDTESTENITESPELPEIIAPAPKAKPKAKRASQNKALVIPEVIPEVTQEETPVQEETQTKTKTRNRPELKEKTKCPDCGKELTLHGLKYTHQRYCKAKRPEDGGKAPLVPPELERPGPQARGGAQFVPVLQARAPSVVDVAEFIPSDEQIANYLRGQRVSKAQRKQQSFTALASRGLPQ